jgi:hypothetical protein
MPIFGAKKNEKQGLSFAIVFFRLSNIQYPITVFHTNHYLAFNLKQNKKPAHVSFTRKLEN